MPPRVVSLLPSASEIICALGAQGTLVGISHECDFPDSIRHLPALTRSRIDAHGSSGAIDAAVRATIIHDALSLYSVDDTRLAALAPDVIVTQDLCHVCAVSLDDVRTAVARLAQREHIDIVSLSPTRLGEVLADIQRVADALAIPDRGHALRATLDARIHAISTRAASLPRPRVASLEWLDPLMVGGTWMPELIELAGGHTLAARAGEPAPTLSAAALADLRPDVVLVKPCGFSLARALAETEPLAHLLATLAPDARVYVTDGNAFFNRPGPRLVESLEIMAACLHPDLFADFAAEHAAVITRLR